MKKIFLTSLLLSGLLSIFQAIQAERIDLLTVVNQNIEQYKQNAMSEQQYGAQTRSLNGRNKQLTNKTFFQKVTDHIKNNKKLLGVLTATAISLWGLKFLLNKMPLDLQAAYPLDGNELGDFAGMQEITSMNQYTEENNQSFSDSDLNAEILVTTDSADQHTRVNDSKSESLIFLQEDE